MPVYLISFHAYGTWMPDRQQGYVKRGRGILPSDEEMGEHYRDAAKHEAVTFDAPVQAALVAAARALCATKKWRLHQVMTDATHIHTLLSWRESASWKSVRRSLRYRYTSDLNGSLGAQRLWLSKGGSRRQVRDRKHFDYLMDEYLPKHDGLYWREDGKTRRECRARMRQRGTGDQNRRL